MQNFSSLVILYSATSNILIIIYNNNFFLKTRTKYYQRDVTISLFELNNKHNLLNLNTLKLI